MIPCEWWQPRVKYERTPRAGEYVEVQYFQADHGTIFRAAWWLLTWSSAVVLFPLILTSRISNIVFKACSEFLSLVPSVFGFSIRYAFYRMTLARCGENVVIDLGTVFYYRDIVIGDNVTFGMSVIVHHCDFGDSVMIGDGCRLIGGTKKHRYDRTDIPICQQGGQIKKIQIGRDSWIDTSCVVMEDIGEGSVIRAGSVVVDSVPPRSVCEGNPAKVVGNR
jgi:acetyltransferase-like isoleucine patch superfamily enzyme